MELLVQIVDGDFFHYWDDMSPFVRVARYTSKQAKAYVFFDYDAASEVAQIVKGKVIEKK